MTFSGSSLSVLNNPAVGAGMLICSSRSTNTTLAQTRVDLGSGLATFSGNVAAPATPGDCEAFGGGIAVQADSYGGADDVVIRFLKPTAFRSNRADSGDAALAASAIYAAAGLRLADYTPITVQLEARSSICIEGNTCGTVYFYKVEAL